MRSATTLSSLIANIMAKRIIDRLETVQVHEQYGQPGGLPCRPFDGHFHAIREQRAVGKRPSGNRSGRG